MRRVQVPLFLLGLVLVATAASAEVYTVTLHSGGTFQSRYRPQEAPWSAEKILVRNELSNWISLDKADVESVTSDTESKGFGLVIDDSTIELGAAANDAPVPEEGKEGVAAPVQAAPAAAPYSIQQFVEPGATQGIPGSYLGNTSSTPPNQ